MSVKPRTAMIGDSGCCAASDHHLATLNKQAERSESPRPAINAEVGQSCAPGVSVRPELNCTGSRRQRKNETATEVHVERARCSALGVSVGTSRPINDDAGAWSG